MHEVLLALQGGCVVERGDGVVLMHTALVSESCVLHGGPVIKWGGRVSGMCISKVF